MKKALIASLIFHFVVAVILLIDFDWQDDDVPPLPPSLSVELVDIDEMNQTTRQAKPPKNKPEEPKEKAKPKDAIAKTSVATPTERPTPDAVAMPDQPPVDKPEVEKTEAKKILPKPPLRKPKLKDTKPVKQPESDQPFQSVLKNLTVKKEQEAEQPPEEVEEDKKAEPFDVMAQIAPLGERMTMTQLDALRRQLEGCWNVPIGARDADDLVVEVEITVNPDKTVADAQIVDQRRYRTEPFFRAAADSALRAVLSDACNPLILPDGKYAQWRKITFRFNPQDMF